MTTSTMSQRQQDCTNAGSSIWDYLADSVQRQILFWDVLRQRGNRYLEHQTDELPPVLSFEYEMVIDGRTLERPVNYALLSVHPPPGVEINPGKRPYIVVDPRAGHGPGIGGSKPDSQVGMAMRAGHPVYFVTFFQEPVSGQRLADVAAAEAHFIEEVARRHPKADGKPCVIGNCQAGWAVAALAAVKPEIMGPIILSGAPLSYWSGASGQNPMRYAGGLLGGKWPASLASDLGDGLFDGAHLVSNFENLDPANTFWKKYYNLYSKIDTEPARFLGFETWWGGYFLMNREEIEQIVSDLFIGNKLSRQQIMSAEGRPIDLRNIRSPIVVFASHGDNITPPQQALNWIIDVYGHEREIIANDQTIIYLLHENVGHLGIFVSGRVASKEHKELVDTLQMIDSLPAGLYEMIIERKDAASRRGELEPGQYLVRFEARKIDDIRSLDDTRKEEGYFQTVEAVSKLNEAFYKSCVSPWLQMMSTKQAAQAGRRLHPLRIQHEWLSDKNPLLAPLPVLADMVRSHRMPVSPDNPFLMLEQMASATITTALNIFRDTRDTWSEAIFNVVYGPAGWGALFPPQAWTPPPASQTQEKAGSSNGQFEAGGPLAAILRIIAAAVINTGVFDRRSARIFRTLLDRSQFKGTAPAQVRELFKQQARLMREDENRALEALAVMLPTSDMRRKALEAVRVVLMIAPEDLRVDGALAKRLSDVLHIDLSELSTATMAHEST